MLGKVGRSKLEVCGTSLQILSPAVGINGAHHQGISVIDHIIETTKYLVAVGLNIVCVIGTRIVIVGCFQFVAYGLSIRQAHRGTSITSIVKSRILSSGLFCIDKIK